MLILMTGNLWDGIGIAYKGIAQLFEPETYCIKIE